MGKRFRILLTIFVFVGVYAFYYLAIPFLLNLEDISPVISRYIKDEYGFNTKIKNPKFKMGYIPSIWFSADDFSILNDDNSKALDVEKPVIKISLLPAVIGHINIKYFSAENIFADLYCDDKIRIKLGQYMLMRMSNFAININDGRVYINNFNINLNDKIKNKKIILAGKYFNIDKFNKDKYLKTSMNTEVIYENKKTVLSCDIDTKLPFAKHLNDYPPEIAVSATNFDLSAFSNFIRYFSNNKISNISGIVNIDMRSDKKIFDKKQYLSEITIDKFAVSTEFFEKNYSYPKRITLKSNYLLEGDRLTVPSFAFIASDFSAKVTGYIDKISSSKPVPDLELKIIDTKSQSLLDLMPYCSKFDKLAKIYVSVIKYAGFYSNVNVDLKIKDNFKRPNLYGNIDVTDAYVTRPIKKAPKNADIHLKYNGDKLHLYVNVPTDINQAVTVDGIIDVYDENYCDLHIKSTPLIDLSETERILMPVHDAFNFLIGPVPIMGFSGYGSIDLKVIGTRKNPHTYGWFKTTKATTYFDDIPNLVLKNADSLLTFNDTNTKFALKSGYINGKKVSIDGTCTLKGVFNFIAKLHQQNAGDLLKVLKTSPMLKNYSQTVEMLETANGNSDLTLHINGALLDIKDLKFGKNVHTSGEIDLKSTAVKLKKLKANVKNLYGTIKFKDNNIKLNLASNLGGSKLNISGDIKNDIANISASSYRLRLSDLLSMTDLIRIVSDNSYLTFKGKYAGSISKFDFKNIKTDGSLNFKNCNIIYKPYNLPIKIQNGQLSIKNSNINIHRFSANVGAMPVTVAGKINGLFDKPYIDAVIYGKPNQKFADYIYNSKVLYPVKVKGNVAFTAFLKGTEDNLDVKSNLRLDKYSSLYYMGASIGGDENKTILNLNARKEHNKINIKAFSYDRIINNSHIMQLLANGRITTTKNNNLLFDNFRIRTKAPTDMKIFNILFKKPLIKKGIFTSNLVINGSLAVPQIRGNLNLMNVDLPFLDATVNGVSLRFLQNNIYADVAGRALDNNFKAHINAQNKLKPPYIINYAVMDAGKLNINTIYEGINNFDLSRETPQMSQSFRISNLGQLVIKKLTVTAQEIVLGKNIVKNLLADISLQNGNLNIDKFNFNLAKGKMEGNVSYNFKSKHSKFNLKAQSVNADELASSMFDLKGQIYGDLDGNISVACTGDNKARCLKTLNGDISFKVKNGRMPKLGSLEYLLKAGNLIKSGITGLSVNGIIELVMPLKTGSFDEIKGNIAINNGVADKIKIISDGKDLNLFITGEYNLYSQIADMYVFGRLVRKVSNILGPVGNVSLNTLFNTIPGVNLNNTSDKGLLNSINKLPGLELSNKLFRVFVAEIHGDISGEDYVESFRWIE